MNDNGIVNGLKKNKPFMTAVKYISIAFGCFVWAVGFQFFLFPNSIVSGGLTGISMIINRFTGLPVGIMIFAMNVPLFVMAWKCFGIDFILASIAGVVFSSAMVDILAVTDVCATHDPMLAAVAGGAVKGAGLGIVYYAGGTTGGSDIVAKMLRKKYININLGTILMGLDAVIIAAYAVIFRIYEIALYSIIAMYVGTKVIDVVLYGFDKSSVFYIISEKSGQIAREIIEGSFHRGVTYLEGEGAYSHRKERVIMCVFKRSQVGEARRMIRSIDPKAFVIVTEAKGVFGKGFADITE